MANMMSVQLDEHDTQLLSDQVSSGRFDSASDVMHEALKLLERQDAAMEELRAEIQKGEDSGHIEGFDMQAWIAKKRREFAA